MRAKLCDSLLYHVHYNSIKPVLSGFSQFQPTRATRVKRKLHCWKLPLRCWCHAPHDNDGKFHCCPCPKLNADETFNQINFNGNFTLNTTLMWSLGLESCILLKNSYFPFSLFLSKSRYLRPWPHTRHIRYSTTSFSDSGGGGGSTHRNPPGQRPLDRDPPWTETPRTKTPPRGHGTRQPDRDPPWTEWPTQLLKTLPCPKLRLRAVKINCRPCVACFERYFGKCIGDLLLIKLINREAVDFENDIRWRWGRHLFSNMELGVKETQRSSCIRERESWGMKDPIWRCNMFGTPCNKPPPHHVTEFLSFSRISHKNPVKMIKSYKRANYRRGDFWKYDTVSFEVHFIEFGQSNRGWSDTFTYSMPCQMYIVDQNK